MREHLDRDELRRRALMALDEALDDRRPDAIKDQLMEVVRNLTTLRDRLIAEDRSERSPQAHERLRRLNQAVSLVAGQENPLAGVQWKRMETARRVIRDLPP